MNRRAADWHRNIALGAASALLTLLLAEGLVRIVLPDWGPEKARVSDFWKHDPRYGWSHVADTTGRFRRYGFDTLVSINSSGFRGPKMSHTRDDSSRRVLLLGDSFVWGFGVDYEETFAHHLSRMVPNLEVVNLGVSGYGTDQELLLYQDEGRKYDADLVVLVVADNDLTSNLRTVESLIYEKPAYILDGNDLALVNHPAPPPSPLRRALVRFASRSYLLNQLHRYREWRAIARAREQERGSGARFPASVAEEITVRLILEIHAATREAGSELLVVFVSGLPMAREAANFLEGYGVESLALEEHLDGSDPDLHVADKFHWNAAGHQIVSKVLAERIEWALPERQPTSDLE